jgi:hypothetical protein
VLCHRDPEYIPLGVYAIEYDIAEKLIGRKNLVRDKIGIQLALWEGRRNEVAQQLKEDSLELYNKLDVVDIVLPSKAAIILPPVSYQPPQIKKLNDTQYEDQDGNIYGISYETNDISIIRHSKREYSVADFPPRPDVVEPDPSIFEAYDFLIDGLKETKFLAGSTSGFWPIILLNGMEEGLIAFYTQPEIVRAAIANRTYRDNYLDGVYLREGIHAALVEYDFGTTKDPLVSPEMFREFCYKAVCERIESIKHFKDKTILHACGNNWKLMNMLVEVGIDCYQSLQTDIMDLGELKHKFGNQMSFWGGVAVETLISGTRDDVRKQVHKAYDEAARNGGFILGPSHSVAYGTKYDNFMTMLEEHEKLKYGAYR